MAPLSPAVGTAGGDSLRRSPRRHKSTAAADAGEPVAATERLSALSHPHSGTHVSGSLHDGEQDAALGFPPDGPLSREAQDFYWDAQTEPHARRRRAILAAHPEVKTLFGPCPRTKWVVLGTVLFQLGMVYALHAAQASWPVVLAAAYVISGTLNHMMLLGIHEIAHNLAFRSPLLNRLLAIVANLPVGIPAAASFRRYHLEHHKYQGEHEVDVDVPTHLEAVLFNSVPGKLLWCFLQPAFYALRPLFVNPKPPGRWEAITAAAVLGYDVLIYMAFGWRGMLYNIGGALLGMGLHPVAGHFIAEHYVFRPGQETYSYYGPLNLVAFNVGYHNEHHDFCNIPGSRLPALRAMCPEFYDSLPYYSSWSGVILDFILNGDLSGFSRVKRETLSSAQRAEIQAREARHA